MKDYTKLRELLESEERFPLEFTYKFIGRATPEFEASVQQLELRFPALVAAGGRESGDGKHSSRTYRYVAVSADAVIEVYRAIEELADLRVVL